MLSLRMYSRTVSRSRRRLNFPSFAKSPSVARVMFPATFIVSTSPSPFRSSVAKPSPARIASSGREIETRLPSTNTSPDCFLSMPKIARAVSVRPAPTSPAMPNISPARTESDMSRTCFPALICSTRRSSRPSGILIFGNFSLSSRPTMWRMISSIVTSWTFTAVTLRPSRMIVARSQMSMTSSSRCDMYMTATPRAFSMRIVENSVSISRFVSGAVGSSITSMREWIESAFATSTICLCATPRSRISARAPMSMPRSSSNFCASRAICRQLTMRRLRMMGLPMKMFSATVNCSVRFNS